MKKNRKKGFTLVELIVVMAIISIFMVMIFSIMAVVGKIASDINSKTVTDQIVTNMSSVLEKKLKYATNVKVFKYYKESEMSELNADGKLKYLYEYPLNTYPDGTLAEEIKCFRINFIVRENGEKGYVYEQLSVDQSTGAINMDASGKFLFSKVFNDSYYGKIYFDFDVSYATAEDGTVVDTAMQTSLTPYTTSDLNGDNIIRTAEKNSFLLENININKSVEKYKLSFSEKRTKAEAFSPTSLDEEKAIYIYYVTRKVL